MPTPTDFSSPLYWSNRFESENSFEWLISDEDLLPFIQESLPSSFADDQKEDTEDVLNILHFGSGTSSLGPSFQHHLDTRQKGKGKAKQVQVYDSDYVPTPTTTSSSVVPFLLLDVLSLSSLMQNLPGGGEEKWNLVIDKSTCDAISCGGALSIDGPSIFEVGLDEEGRVIASISDPIERLLYNLSQVTQTGGRWISISYSSNRFDNYLSDWPSAHKQEHEKGHGDNEKEIKYGWILLKRQMISTTYIPSGRVVKDPRTGEERVVHEPETGVWMYVLERV
ncbi:hypothetical protein I302_106484 [Kwoniella bestiolae CBS 10118]|uniref:Methyltransferase type 11 domain-containing protein n=1 Tax=Kwoniella bestiolae CBS 10118 TaxID=1296100 RepID=A0A1B9G199_9TREE|nr:hypothetical protein I302_06258 [Kwoniella bestiolae CBS 10118]OCF24797.1 hypothetical protein I302_06258 [Kwoniella bestiolae CBS 10118]